MSQFENPGLMHMGIRKWKVQTPFWILATLLSLVVLFLCIVQGLEINMVSAFEKVQVPRVWHGQ